MYHTCFIYIVLIISVTIKVTIFIDYKNSLEEYIVQSYDLRKVRNRVESEWIRTLRSNLNKGKMSLSLPSYFSSDVSSVDFSDTESSHTDFWGKITIYVHYKSNPSVIHHTVTNNLFASLSKDGERIILGYRFLPFTGRNTVSRIITISTYP